MPAQRRAGLTGGHVQRDVQSYSRLNSQGDRRASGDLGTASAGGSVGG